MKILELIPVFVEEIKQNVEEGILYISEKYGISIHLCACGCGIKTALPLGEGEWTLTKNTNGTVSLMPSIGNWSGEDPYHAHYHITENKIVPC